MNYILWTSPEKPSVPEKPPIYSTDIKSPTLEVYLQGPCTSGNYNHRLGHWAGTWVKICNYQTFL